MKLTLTIPGISPIETTDLPTGVPTGGTGMLNNIIAVGIIVLVIIAIFFAGFNLIRGAINILTSGGDKERFAKGRERLRYAIVGLLIIFFSIFIISLFRIFLGVNLLGSR